ncbi:MAG: hypothetical protein QF578_19760 [Alphaproteobacteria bacterium]|jgi:hypothetical protein|nr:hypothetical protein [Alphaproteobacteria bacterium]MDP6811579.1 hypothetical protein [Alphaproteobacteria bacterium]
MREASVLYLHRALAVLVSCYALGLSACTTGQTHALVRAVYAPPFRIPPPEMQKLCDEHDGMKIYRTADNVAGFADKTIGVVDPNQGCRSTCKQALKSRSYRFVEAAASEKYIRGDQPRAKPYRSLGYFHAFVERPGLYRFTREKLGHANCRIFEQWHAAKYPNLIKQGRRFPGFEKYCIATWPIERFTARHEIQEHHITRERSYGWLNTIVKTVINRKDGILMAESRRHFINFSKHDGGVHCVHDKEVYVGWNLQKVLKPVMPRR